MSIERIKTIVLAILVVMSIYISLKIVNYQPEFKKLIKEEKIQEITIHKTVSGNELLSPIQINIHADGQHYGNGNEEQTNELINEVLKSNIESLKDISRNYTDVNISESIRDFRNIELVFSDVVPLDVYKKYINLIQKSNLNINFDRIVVPYDTGESSMLFISSKEKKVLEAKLENSKTKEFTEQIENIKKEMVPLTPVQISMNSMIYIPSEKVTVSQRKYFKRIIKQNKLEEALFNDEHNLRQTISGKKETVTDGISMMDIDLESMTMTYIKPLLGNREYLNASDKLLKSIDFVNSHAGWDNRYRYVSSGEYDSAVRFRLFINNVPVFSDTSMSEISVLSRKDGIESYSRPMFYLDFELVSEEKKQVLESGTKVLNHLQSLNNFQMENLENLMIGYSIVVDNADSDIVNLIPMWYYKYNGVWNKVE